MIVFLAIHVMSQENLTFIVGGEKNNSYPELSLINLFLIYYMRENLTYEVFEWFNDAHISESQYLGADMMCVYRNIENSKFSFFLEYDYELHQKDESYKMPQITISNQNFCSLMLDMQWIDETRPEIAYIIDKDGWIYIDTKLPDEVSLEITKVQKKE